MCCMQPTLGRLANITNKAQVMTKAVCVAGLLMQEQMPDFPSARHLTQCLWDGALIADGIPSRSGVAAAGEGGSF